MKKSFNLIFTASLVLISWSIQAQYDDVYYGSSFRKKAKPLSTSSYEDYANTSTSPDNEYYEDQEGYDDYDDSYNNLDEYDYAYTHRIRRFHRPLAGRSFYDPFYLDPWNFDPYYYSSGFGFITPRLGISFYSFNDYNRWNRWNRYNRFRYWDPWAYSYWSYDPFAFNRFNNYYWASNSWCPSSWYSNRYYSSNNYWGNSYNNVYQPRYYTDKSVHFGPRTYGATTTGDRGPSRSSSRVFSDPGQNRPNNPGLKRSPREDAQTTVVRERNVAIDRNSPASPDRVQEKLSPRTNDRESVRERTQSTPSNPKTYRDYDNGQPDRPQTTRPSPRNNDENYRERIRSSEQSPRSIPRTEERQISPRTERSRSESPRFESAPRQESPRFETPRQEAPRYEAPRQESPRSTSPRKDNGGAEARSRSDMQRFESRSVPRSAPDRTDYSRPSNGGNNGSFGGSSRSYSGGNSSSSGSSGGSNAGGGGRTSPRNQ